MANKYGYMAKIGIDTSDIQAGLSEADSALRAFSREMRAVNETIRQSGGSAEMATQRNQLYTEQISQLTRRLQALLYVEQEINRARANGTISEAEYRAYRREIEQTEASIRRLTEEQQNLDASTGQAMESTSAFGDVLKANIATKALEALVNILREAAMAMKDYALEGIEMASDLTEKQNVVEVTFGNKSSKIYEFADTAAEKFGLAKLAAEGYAGTLGALFKSSGITEGIEDMAVTMAGLAGDMASFYNISSDMAFEKLRSGISGESEPLKQLGINLSVANLEAYALSQGLKTAWKDMSQAEQTMLRYNYILSQTADAQGDFGRTADSFANQQRIMELNFQTLQAEIGEKLLPVAQDMLSLINDNMPEIKEAANYLADEMIPVIRDLSEEAEEFVENGGLQDIVDIFKWLIEHKEGIIGVFEGLFLTSTVSNAVKLGGSLKEMVTSFTGIVAQQGGIRATAAALGQAGVAAEAGAVSFGIWAAALIAAIAAGEALADVIDEAAEKLDDHSERVLEIEKEAEEIAKISESFKELEKTDIASAWEKADHEIKNYCEQLKSVQKLVDAYQWKIDMSKVNPDLYTEDEVKEFQDQLGSYSRKANELRGLVYEQEQLLSKYNQNTITHIKESADIEAKMRESAGKTNADALGKAWETIRQRTKEEMEKYDEELATHKISEPEYFAKRKAYLESHRDEESAEWWAYYDEVTGYYDKLSEEERKAAEKAAEEAEKLRKEQLEAIEKANQEEIEAWESSAKETADAIKDAYKEAQDAIEEAKGDYLKSGTELGESVTDKDGNERFILDDLDKEKKALEKYRKSMDKLRETGISDSLIDGIMQFDYKDGSRQQFIDELLGMSDSQRQRYYKDYEEYISAVQSTAEYDAKDELAEANALAKEGMGSIYESMPAVAYDKGKETAASYYNGIIDGMADCDPVISEAFRSSVNLGKMQAQGGNLYSGDTVINFVVDSSKIVSKTIDELASMTRKGLNPLNG